MDMVIRKASSCILFIFLLFLLIFSENSAATNILTLSKGLSVGETLISVNEIFELGFFTLGNPSKRYVGTWYKNITGHKPIWVANRSNPLEITDNNSSLSIGNDGNLRLLNGMKNTVWSTNITSRPNGTYAMLCTEGDLILKDYVSGANLWRSFSYPGDSFIAGMEIGSNRRTGEEYFLTSWRGDNDPSPGNFVMGITTEKPPQLFVWKSSKPYWRSGQWDGWKFIGLHKTDVGYANGLIVTQDNQQGSVYLTYNLHSDTYATLVILSSDGVLKMSHWNIDVTKGGETWEALHLPCEVYGTCGPYGVCDRAKSNTCKCLTGFVPKFGEEWENGNWTGGCVRRTELVCGKKRGFRKFSKIKLPDKHEYMFNVDASGCRKWCLGNCSCVAYAYVSGIDCMVWGGDLLDLQHFDENGADLFLQVDYSELERDKDWTKLVIILTTVPAILFFIAFLYLIRNRIQIHKVIEKYELKKVKFIPNGNLKAQSKSSDLPMFDFNKLAAATNNFDESNKLGEGGFGPVYRGKLDNEQEIAVKRLAIHSGQGALEFKNEILLISKLQHRNLVKLVGYCIEGDEKLLMYEHLKNKSLDTFLFDTNKSLELDWGKRFNIIIGIARGLLYLHRDSCLRIIHRDLKAGNILLDDNMNPKISDFGTARAFQITQELTNTHRVVGTYGYLSPEYAVGGMFSEKSDIFAFGVLILEIVSGIKVMDFACEEKSDLLGHAWNLWKEDKGLTLINRELSNSCSETEFTKCLQIALLCVQDHASERPTMSSVVLMLTSDVDIPQPTQPTFYHSLINSDFHPQKINVISRNDLSLSIVVGR